MEVVIRRDHPHLIDPHHSMAPPAAVNLVPFEQVSGELVPWLKLLADPTRLRILYALLQQELHVRAMCDLLGQSQPAVSHHLALLREAGLILCRREGKHNYYHLVAARFEQIASLILQLVVEQRPLVRVADYAIQYEPR